MRVLVVSAHYPPNFVSGGTIGPQRISRGLRARGHDVSVYAGWLGKRAPLETWTAPDEDGMPVRWIVVTPWTDWSNRRNFSNPDVTTDFRLHLEEVRPDLVHVHSLQSLGVGIVQACAAAGVRVVVTMHDFWWICGRQFLSNRALKPCSLVVSCGMCHCQVDRRWLDERDEELRHALRSVDQILAVSESSAAVLRANGIGTDPEGPPLIVDENGLPSLPEHVARERLTGDRVTFLYTGGSEPLKGAHVVLEAARQLCDLDGWTLHAYGIKAYLDEHGLTPPARLAIRPRFSPDEADAVFDAADVLLLPSVVRESHSLVTREALFRGMPVITTDTLGPEEVVVDRENGFVIPAGDAEALAEVMRRLVVDRRLRHHVAKGARGGVRIRPLEDQIDALDRRFVEIASAPPSEAPAAPLRLVRRVLFMTGIDGAPLRYRAHFAAEALALVGVQSWVRHYRSPENAALAALSDAVVVYRVPATRQVLALIAATQARGVPVFYDVDDLIFDPDVAASIPAVQELPAEERRLYLEGVHRYRTTLEACDAFIGTTEMLVDHARLVAGVPTHRWWNGVGIGPARCSDAALAQPRTPGPLRIGYMSGTKTHDEDWRFVEPAIVEVLRTRHHIELWLGGLVTPTAALAPFGERIRRIELKPWWELPWVLRDLDVNLAPLAPGGSFNEAKSAIKWLEAALAETPTVATPTQPFRECITPGVTGELAHTVEQFVELVGGLLDDRLARIRMGKLARREALLRWSPHLQGERYLDILQNAAVGRESASTWTSAVVLDEPWADIPAEGYIVPDAMILGPTERDFGDGEPAAEVSPTSGIAAKARSRVHRELATARRAASVVARRTRPPT